MQHSFSVEVAQSVGVQKAIILHNIVFRRQKDKANNHNFHDNKWRVYNSSTAFEEIMPYLTNESIKRWLRELVDEGYLFKGCYNKSGFDKTLWYSPTDKVLHNYGLSTGQNEPPTGQNEPPTGQNEPTIPVSNPIDNLSVGNLLSSSNEEEPMAMEEFGKPDVNKVIEVMKQSCNDAGLQYMPGKMEREFAKHILSKKLANEIEKYNMPLFEFIDNIIKLSAQPYTKQCNTPQLFYQNWGHVINSGTNALKAQKENGKPIYVFTPM